MRLPLESILRTSGELWTSFIQNYGDARRNVNKRPSAPLKLEKRIHRFVTFGSGTRKRRRYSLAGITGFRHKWHSERNGFSTWQPLIFYVGNAEQPRWHIERITRQMKKTIQTSQIRQESSDCKKNTSIKVNPFVVPGTRHCPLLRSVCIKSPGVPYQPQYRTFDAWGTSDLVSEESAFFSHSTIVGKYRARLVSWLVIETFSKDFQATP